MADIGVVRRIRDGWAKVELLDCEQSTCEIARQPGGACCSCKAFSAGRVVLDVELPGEVKPGDRLTLEVPRPSPVLSALLLLLIPLVLFGVGLGAGHWLGAAASDQEPEMLLSAGLGLGLMVAWYVGLAVFERLTRRSPKRRIKVLALAPADEAG